MAGARGLWRATGMKDEDFGKPIIAVECEGLFGQSVLCHDGVGGVHLDDVSVEEADGF